jgi:hypothetical protein
LAINATADNTILSVYGFCDCQASDTITMRIMNGELKATSFWTKAANLAVFPT